MSIGEMLILTTRSAERLRSILALLTMTEIQLISLGEIDPQIDPELGAVRKHLDEAIGAIERAAIFLDARLEATEDE